jgi:hypothetical protein
MKHVALVACSALLIINSSLFSQETTGSIEGWVFDAKGEPVVGANVVVNSVVLQGTRGGTTSSNGRFRLFSLPPGSYSVRLTHISSKPVLVEKVHVLLGHTTTLGEVVMGERQAEIQEVVIVGNRSSFDPQSTIAGVNLGEDRFKNLPIDRGYMSLMRLAPLSTPSYYGDGINIAGATGIENRYFINGADVTDGYIGASATQLPYNFVREVQIRSGAYEAEHQSSLGGIVNVVTHSGGNEPEGHAFGFFSNNRLTGSPRLTLGEPSKGEFAEYDIGVSMGGPIIRDQLWYFAAYNPRFRSEVVPVTGQEDQRGSSTTHMFAGKVTWNANDAHAFTLSVAGDPVVGRGVGENLFGQMYPYDVLDLNSYVCNIHKGSTSMILSGTHICGSTVLLESSLSIANRKFEYSPVGNSGAYSYIDLESMAIGGTYQRSFERTSQIHSGIRTTLTLAEHTLKAGLEYSGQRFESEDVWRILVRYPDDSFVLSYRNFSGKIATHTATVFLQDSWRASKQFTINLGLRWEPQILMASDGTVGQEIIGCFGPRLGVIFVPDAASADRITLSVGRFYQPVGLNLPATYLIKTVQGVDISYPQDPRIDTSGAASTTNLFSFFGNVRGLRGQYYDEIAAAYERQFSPRLKATLRGTFRGLGQGVEDGFSSKEGRLVYGNPGSPPLEEYPEVIRRNSSIELSVDYAEPSLFSVQLSYTLSRNFGNYSGLAEASYYSANSGVELWPNTSWEFQIPYMLNNALGLLPNDRTHVFKLFGSYSFEFGLTIGVDGFWMSGTPKNELGAGPLPLCWPVFLHPRGSCGRTPSIWDANLRIIYDLGSTSGRKWHPRIIVDVLHAFSQKTSLQVDEQHYWSSDDGGNQTDPNSNYGTPIQFTPPTSIRLGLEVDF